MTEVRIKGGMPVLVSNNSGIVIVRWFNTGKMVSGKFYRSISEADWERIDEALREA